MSNVPGIMGVSFGIFNGYAPKNGPRSITYFLDFSTLGSYDLNLYLEESMKQLEFVQTIHVNNFANAATLTIATKQTQQTMVVPIAKQAILPLYAIDQTNVTISTTPAASLIIPVIFLNVPLPAIVW